MLPRNMKMTVRFACFLKTLAAAVMTRIRTLHVLYSSEHNVPYLISLLTIQNILQHKSLVVIFAFPIA